jgi:uncharacterized protein YdaU (DUF1376 family)
MNGSPSFQFYPADWISDEKVIAMSMAGEGCYIRLLSHCWREGSIPADRSAIVLLCKGYDGPGIDEALTCFVPSRKHGRLINKRAELERKKQENFRKLKQDAGLRGANSRWHPHGNRIPSAMANDGSSSSSSSSSSTSIKNKEKEGQTAAPFDQLFIEFWNAYPKKVHKKASRTIFLSLCEKGLIKEFSEGFSGYMNSLKISRVHKNFKQEPMNPETFMGEDRWREYMGVEYTPPL